MQKNWLRYLDDCYINWIFTDEKLHKFHTLLNSLNTNIESTIEKSTRQMLFLAILIHKDNDRRSTDIYYKTTDTHQYLDFTSNLPRHIKISIPYNLARRVCTIVDDDVTKNKRLKQLQQMLINRNYPRKIIQTGIDKAKALYQQDLRTVQEKKQTDNTVTLVTTFNPNNPSIKPLIETGLMMLKTNPRLRHSLQGIKIIHNNRQSPNLNLKQLLTRSKFIKFCRSVHASHDVQ